MSQNSPMLLSKQQILFAHFQEIIPGHFVVKKIKRVSCEQKIRVMNKRHLHIIRNKETQVKGSSTVEKREKYVVRHQLLFPENICWIFLLLTVSNPLLPQPQKWLLESAVVNYWELTYWSMSGMKSWSLHRSVNKAHIGLSQVVMLYPVPAFPDRVYLAHHKSPLQNSFSEVVSRS